MAIKQKRMYAEIAKTEAQDDGTIKVWGYASTGAEDSDKETVTADAMKAALPDYMKFGAVREMHDATKAAGTAIEASVGDDGKTWFGAHVVDPTAVIKVQTGVYKGFSIGGKVTKRDDLNKSVIKGIKLVEVSLVDRPANPEAVITVMKAERTQEDDVEELADLLDGGGVTPAQVLALVKASKEPAPVVVETTIEKGMYSLSEFASVLNSVGYLCTDAEWESQYEGDSSPIPAKLREWLAAGVAIFKDMAVEETAELVSRLAAEAAPLATTVKAEGTDDLNKAGAKFSKATKDALSKIHGACKEAAAHLDGLGYADDDTEKVNKVADTDGISALTEEAIQKAISTAIAPLNEALEKARKDNTDLTAKVEQLSKMAAPGKALLKVLSINKSADVDTSDAQPAEAAPPEGTEQRAEYEMRKVFSTTKRLA